MGSKSSHRASFFDKISIPVMRTAYEKLGYAFFTKGDYNVNLFGIRNMEDLHSEYFNDVIGMIYKHQGDWKLLKVDATVDPGTMYRKSPSNSKGVACLRKGQHRGMFQIGLHKGKYKAFVQRADCTVHRDNNKDAKLDLVGEDTGYFGINLHLYNSKYTIETIGCSSEGCSVCYDPADLAALLAVGEIARASWGNSFTYTLFHSDEIFG